MRRRRDKLERSNRGQNEPLLKRHAVFRGKGARSWIKELYCIRNRVS
jgi:hypothetical protein